MNSCVNIFHLPPGWDSAKPTSPCCCFPPCLTVHGVLLPHALNTHMRILTKKKPQEADIKPKRTQRELDLVRRENECFLNWFLVCTRHKAKCFHIHDASACLQHYEAGGNPTYKWGHDIKGGKNCFSQDHRAYRQQGWKWKHPLSEWEHQLSSDSTDSNPMPLQNRDSATCAEVRGLTVKMGQ